jgi:synaptojanin
MSRPAIKLLVRDQPRRSIALATDRHALVLKGASGAGDTIFPPRSGSQTSLAGAGAGAPRCIAEFGAAGAVDWDEYRPLGFRDIYGTLGLIGIGGEVFLCVVTSATQAAEIRPGEVVQKINTVEFRMGTLHVRD